MNAHVNTVQIDIGSRKYQEDDVPWFISHPRSLILYDPRMGKTVVTVRAVGADSRTRIVLIACSKNAMGVWRDHIEGMWDQIDQFGRSCEVRLVKGKNPAKAKAERDKIWMAPRKADVTFFIVTFAALERDVVLLTSNATRKSGLIFDTFIGDEVHLRMKNRKNKTVSVVKSLTYPKDCHRVHLLSGTLAGKGGPLDFWACLNVLAPGLFTSYWKFAYRYMEVVDGTFGKEIISIRDLPGWHSLLDSWSRRRFRAIDAPGMPAVQRSLRRVDPDAGQRRLYDQFVEQDFVWSGDNLIIAQNSLEWSLRVRQLLTCPAMLDPALGVGAAMNDLIERLTDDDATDDDRHTVIFTEFAKAVPFFKHALENAGFKHVFVLKGGMEPEDLADTIAAFRRTRGIVICTIKYAQAFSLEPAKESHAIGYSWDPADNKQAEDRLVPQAGVNPILANYYCYRDTYDEAVAYVVNVKNRLVTMTMGNASELLAKNERSMEQGEDAEV